MVISRDFYLNKLIDKQGNGLVKVITGLRRSGKSFLLFEIFRKYLIESGYRESNIIRINFDDYESMDLQNANNAYNYIFSKIKSRGKYVVLLDEVQLLNNFVPILNSLLNRHNVDCYVTGSNAKFLSKDVITEFSGRGDEIHLLPLSFSEILPLYDDENKAFEDFSLYGGLPQVYVESKDTEKMKFLKRVFEETYLIDIKRRYKTKKIEELVELINILASNVGSLSSIRNIVNTYKSKYDSNISINTVKNYIEMFKDSFLINEVERYDIKGKKYIGALKKYYFEDIGLRNARLQFRQLDQSHLMENIIYNELIRKGYEVDVGIIDKKELKNNKRDNRRYEVDFIARLGHKKYYIQSAYEMGTDKKREQEYKSLNLLEDGFKRFVIRFDNNRTYINDYGIINIGLFDFLLNDDCFNFE